MNANRFPSSGRTRSVAATLLTVGIMAAVCRPAPAQFTNNRAVGGISIDTEGLLQNARIDDVGELRRVRTKALAKVPDALNERTELRKISLRKLEAAVAKYKDEGKELPDEIKYLAGLQQVRYVIADPESHDIILAGPAEGWRVDPRGFVVGVTTGRPVLLLDDLVVALRTARQAAAGEISCSIDPTAEGLARLQRHVAGLRTIGNPPATAKGIEEVLGAQAITVEGVPAASHFARVLVAADFRMKRIAMGFEPSPVRALPSYLSMIRAGATGIDNMLPRWWMEPCYEELLRDAEGLTWELRGSGVKTLTEEDFLDRGGRRVHTGQARPAAQQWADKMTAGFDELSVADPIFGQLRGCMDLAVVAALVVHHRLGERADCPLPLLLEPSGVAAEPYLAPKQVASQASLVKKNSSWVIAVSGGVKIKPEAELRRARIDAELNARRIESAVGKHDDWWWN